MIRIESAGGGEALTRLIKMWSKLNTFQSGTEAQQDRVYTGDRSKPAMTKRTCDARRRVKAYRPVLSRKKLENKLPSSRTCLPNVGSLRGQSVQNVQYAAQYSKMRLCLDFTLF